MIRVLAPYASIMVVILLQSGCASNLPNLDTESEAKKEQKSVYAHPYTDVWRSALQAADQLGWRVTFADREAGQIRAFSPRHMGALNDELRVRLRETQRGIEVVVRSKHAWEPNREIVKAFLAEIGHRL